MKEKTIGLEPEVSVIVPCFNEERTIQLLLKAILEQTYPQEKVEVIIADAYSQDRTREMIDLFVQAHPTLRVRVVDNNKRTIPAAVNLAASHSDSKYLVRLDAHSVPYPSYICNCVTLLEKMKAQNVGGVWDIQPGSNTCIAKAIAYAASHPIGAGDAKYRLNTAAAFVDTVPFGAYLRETFIKMGGFNEGMLANEDYEFNARIREAGGKIWMDPSIRCVYYARKNLKELAAQYWRYGYWKWQMLRSHPRTLRWRQAIPTVFCFSIYVLAILSLFSQIPRIILAIVLLLYLTILFFFSLIESKKNNEICCLLMVPSFMTMHFSWGSGFWYSLIIGNKRN